MKNIKTRYLWVGVAALFLIAIGLIVGCSYADSTLNKILIVFLAIDFILLTILIQYASYRTFKYKPKLKKLPHKEYSSELDINEALNKGFKKRELEFGSSYLKIVEKTAYKVSIIDNVELYFNPSKEEKSVPNKQLDKCTRLINFEIFINPSEDTLLKLPDFSMQGDKVYCTALAKTDNYYKCVNYLEPNDSFRDAVDNLITTLGLAEISEEVEN